MLCLYVSVTAHLQDDYSKRWDHNNSLHLSDGSPEGHAMLVLFQD